MNGFLEVPATTPPVQALYDQDVAEVGYVMNASRMWAHAPALHDGIFDLLAATYGPGGLDERRRGILIAATAASLGDAYCSLAWGSRLAQNTDPQLAAGVLRGEDGALSPPEQAIAAWARKVTRNPSSTSAQDVQTMRDAGLDDAQIFAVTVFVSLRIAFSTVNGALGAAPDAAFRATTPSEVLQAVGYGRPIEGDPMNEI